MGVVLPNRPERRPLWLDGLLMDGSATDEAVFRAELRDAIASGRGADGIEASCSNDSGVPEMPSAPLESHVWISPSPIVDADTITGICIPDRLDLAMSVMIDAVTGVAVLESPSSDLDATSRNDAPSAAAEAAASAEDAHTPMRYAGSDRTWRATAIGTPADEFWNQPALKVFLIAQPIRLDSSVHAPVTVK